MLDGFWRDFAFALRSLMRRPGYFIAAVTTLALGIGANTAIFGVVKCGVVGTACLTPIRGVYGSGALLETLGVTPLLGRTFVAADDVAGNPSEVVLSHGFWQRRYGGARDVIGKSIVLNGVPRPIVGVMPAGFEFPLREASGLPARSHSGSAIPPRAPSSAGPIICTASDALRPACPPSRRRHSSPRSPTISRARILRTTPASRSPRGL